MNARNSTVRWGLMGWMVLCTALTACGGPLLYAPKGTAKAPETDAKIVAKVDAGASITHLTINAEHLAPPDRLNPGGTTFVVWAHKGNDTTRIGALKYDVDGRKGELTEVSVPQTKFELLVSVEQQPDPPAPSAIVVIAQKIND
jgi:hypothetical protein